MKKSKLLALILAAAMVITAGGCGFTGSSGGTAASGTEQTASSGAASSDTITVYDTNEIRTMVQWAASDTNSFTILNNVSEGLYRLNAKHEPEPALAQDCKISDDKLTYTFTLRDGLKWSNGTSLTAKDFVFSWLKQMSADATNGYSFIMTDYIVNGEEYLAGKAKAEDVGVKALDDKTFEVKLKQPTPYFIRLTTLPMFFPLNEEFVKSKGDKYGLDAGSMIYCGPYVLTSYDPASGSVMKKNDSYWDAANVKVPNVKVRIIKEQATALNAYKAGELSRVILSSSDVPAMKSSPEFSSNNEFRTTYLQFNLTDKTLSNKNIRTALGYAIDRKTLADAILSDGSAPATGLIPNYMYGNGKETFRELNGDITAFDAAKAKEYWDKGVKELGSVPTLTLLTEDDSVTKTVATYLQSEFKKNLGIDVKIDSKTKKARNQLMDNNNFQMAITAWGADYDDAMTYMDLWTNGTPYRGSYKSDTYNGLIADAKKQTDDEKRLQDMLTAEKLLVVNDAVVSPLFYRGSAYLTKPNVKNLVTHPFGAPIEFKYASLN
ncbi:peptide ABC transporter substrate-binding protein [Caproiciproducens galactitolivorans]|uniref:Dipeptide-binding protein DppE n=1 Tax=Caproiciproducens galactitolivorans TaxID=642589 RepID=A0A4Z0YDE0_9FIRM|nr:peptide ABC transporter substrate-binding protein [Caproiciproducens galactitolivorans]QEY35228.1 peptide ABC transporter substrate-binding protein [Caproiciproducens galactitolivorans]TGJ76920.1 dipeptide-binding protein DppE precursor [Caproiciproducens galactitolivorans]